MPLSPELTDDALISQAQELRRQALHGNSRARVQAHEHEAELRGRLKRLIFDETDQTAKSDRSLASSCPQDQAGRARLQVLATITSPYLVTTADDTTDAAAHALSELLRNTRELLAMDIAFVSEFSNGRRIFRYVDADPSQPAKLKVGQSDRLEETYCQRVVDGRLPLAIPNTAELPEANGLAVTQSLEIRAYLSAPVVLADGKVYGTLCCISHQPRTALGSRQVDALRTVAALVSSEIEKSRRAAVRH